MPLDFKLKFKIKLYHRCQPWFWLWHPVFLVGIFFHLFGFLRLFSPYALHQEIADEELAVAFSSKIYNDYFFRMVFLFW